MKPRSSNLAGPAMVVGLLLCASVFLLYAYTSNHPFHRPVPDGNGDVFAYAYMAKAMDQGRWLSDHTVRPFLTDLVRHLRDSGYREVEYYETIAPPGYHLDDRSGRIINQYPPGTSLILTLLPMEYRFHLFPVLCSALFLIPALFAMGWTERRISPVHLSLGLLLLFLMVVWPPPLFSLYDVNSLAPTYGLLFAAGYLLRAGSGWSLVFLGTASLFRIANLIFFLPFVAFYVGRGIKGPVEGPTWLPGIGVRRAMAGTTLFLAGGFGVYLWYAWRLTGSPFHPTYPIHDRALSTVADMARNLEYFSFHSPWFVMHVILWVLLFLLSLPSLRWSLIGLALALYNYAFFVLHKVHVINYPYATLFILMGLLAFEIIRKLQNPLTRAPGRTQMLLFLAVLGCAGVAGSGLRMPPYSVREVYRQAVKSYGSVFSGYDVIWGRNRGMTIEYALGKPTMTYLRGTREARNEVIQWLHRHHYTQALWVEDIDPSSGNAIVRELESLQLPHERIVHPKPYYGEIIRIP